MSSVFFLRIVPGAKKKRWALTVSGEIKCYVTAPAVDGKANKALIDTLSDDLSIAKSKIKIVSGHTSRVKKIEIDCEISAQDLLRILGLDIVQTTLWDG